MKEVKTTIPSLIFVLIVTVLASVSLSFLPSDNEPLGTEEAGPGRKWYRIDVIDPCGNYVRRDGVPNHLRMKFYGDVDGLQLAGLSPYPPDPNWLVVNNAVPDVNEPNQTLEGHFFCSKVWKPGDHQIGYQVADSNSNTDCKWGYFIIRDKKPPKVKDLTKSQGARQ
jgi:hypothetical protein